MKSGSRNGSLPDHIAIIMDGNGRWAKQRGLRRVKGHEKGIESVRAVATACSKLGIEQLTLYAFSAENWKRPKSEIFYLMRLLEKFLVEERPTIMENDIRFTAIGRLEKLPSAVRLALAATRQISQHNRGMVLSLALNYGGRMEIVDATKNIIRAVQEGKLKGNRLSQRTFARYLYDPGMSDPDLLIRTAGEMRLSNFLLWQASYSELYVTDTCWPDFRKPQLMKAIEEYRRRERRFGGLAGKT